MRKVFDFLFDYGIGGIPHILIIVIPLVALCFLALALLVGIP